MKKKLLAFVCAAAMAGSLMTAVSAEEASTDITIGVSFGQNVHPFL